MRFLRGASASNAARALLLARVGPQRSPLWAQRLKARDLLAVVRRHPDFPIVLETYREILSEVFDLPSLEDLLVRVRSREVEVHDVETRGASPFARSLVFAQVAAHLYEADAPPAERRAQALALDRGLLEELLGRSELRELIDADVLATVETELQRIATDRLARDPDELHDLLRRVGDLDLDALRARSASDPEPWLATLAAQKRASRVTVGGASRWIAAEDAALYADAALPDLLRRMRARTARSGRKTSRRVSVCPPRASRPRSPSSRPPASSCTATCARTSPERRGATSTSGDSSSDARSRRRATKSRRWTPRPSRASWARGTGSAKRAAARGGSRRRSISWKGFRCRGPA